MPLPVPDIDENTPTGFQPMDPGIYDAQVTDFDIKEASGESGKLEAGTEYVQYTFEILSEPYQGRTIKSSVYFTEKSKPKLKEFFVGMGLDDERIAALAGTEFDAGEYVGTTCKLQITLQKPNESGIRYNNVSRVLPVDAEELPQ